MWRGRLRAEEGQEGRRRRAREDRDEALHCLGRSE